MLRSGPYLLVEAKSILFFSFLQIKEMIGFSVHISPSLFFRHHNFSCKDTYHLHKGILAKPPNGL